MPAQAVCSFLLLSFLLSRDKTLGWRDASIVAILRAPHFAPLLPAPSSAGATTRSSFRPLVCNPHICLDTSVRVSQGTDPFTVAARALAVPTHRGPLAATSRPSLPTSLIDHFSLKTSSLDYFFILTTGTATSVPNGFLSSVFLSMLFPLLRLHFCPTCLPRNADSSSSLRTASVMKRYQPSPVRVTTDSPLLTLKEMSRTVCVALACEGKARSREKEEHMGWNMLL